MIEVHPLTILAMGIATVIGMIVVLRLNAFLALITAAILVSLLAPGEWPLKLARVAEAFGTSAGKIGIVIALAAVIGKCMMDSGAADRVVRTFLGLLGERRASVALMGSGFVLAVPVFFDTVFYLLIPLARALRRRTGKDYLKYILSIAAGGAITHTLVPPTPGPLLMAANLNVDVGTMILVGLVVALPAAVLGGLLFASVANRLLDIPLRPLPGEETLVPLDDDRLPSLFVSLLPVVLPVLLISSHTITKTLVEARDRQVSVESAVALVDEPLPASATPDLLERAAAITAVLGDANLALLLSAVVAMAVAYRNCNWSRRQLAEAVEISLMSGGVIILITAAGGSFGAMLDRAQVGPAIEEFFGGDGLAVGQSMLWLGFGVAAVLKAAQGSSTVAMITASGMLAAMLSPDRPLDFNAVYLATAIGSGSLIGSWMNDSGFWVVAKMSGLSESETLASWTLLLVVLGSTGMLTTLILSRWLPLL